MRSNAFLKSVCVTAALTLGGDWFVPVTTVLHAQTEAFVGGMIGVNLEPPGEAGNRFLDVGLGGNSLAGGVSVLVSISPKVSIAVEASFAGAFTEHQLGRISGGRRTELLSDITPGRVDGPFFLEYDHTSLGVVGGLDVIAARWSHVVVAPSLRLHWFDQDDGDVSTRLGLGLFAARPAVNVEVHF